MLVLKGNIEMRVPYMYNLFKSIEWNENIRTLTDIGNPRWRSLFVIGIWTVWGIENRWIVLLREVILIMTGGGSAIIVF